MAGVLSHMWYVKAADRVWGPYPETRIAEFVREGRVGAQTPVSPFATGPFAPAAANPEFAALMQARTAPAAPQPAPTPVPAAPASVYPAPIYPASVHPAPHAAAEPQPRAAPEPPGPEPSTVEPAPETPTPAQSGPLRPLLVWAELSEETMRAFPAALAAFGPGVGVRPGLWLIQARMGAAALRNLLSRRLGASDALMVVEAPLDQVAWFNVEPVRDRELRRLWSAAKGG
jgi:hypothetical protein